MSDPLPTQIVVGPPHHGVAEYAAELARSTRVVEPAAPVVRLDTAEEAEAESRRHPRVHLHVTDQLFGDTLEAAADRVVRMARSSAVTITLHDVPQPSDGERNLRRRADAYRRMTRAAVAVAVSSRHEELLVQEHLGSGDGVMVVPLGTRTARAPEISVSFDRDRCVILVAGFVYPGKGHGELLQAAAVLARDLGIPVDVVALGGVSRGHEAEAGRLAIEAAATGVRFVVTGYLAADEYRRRFRSSGVPVVAHRHYSASRSLLDWAEQGRRAIVLDSRYVREMADLRPGTLLVTSADPAALVAGIKAAWLNPASTVLPSGTPIGPTLDDCAAAYVAWWRSLAW